jgi:hypothetical protein
VLEANGQALVYVYARETKAEADIAKVLTFDEARRIAVNVARLPGPLEGGIHDYAIVTFLKPRRTSAKCQ